VSLDICSSIAVLHCIAFLVRLRAVQCSAVSYTFETRPRRRRDVENRVEGIHEDASLLTYLVRRVMYNYYGTTDFAGLVNDPSANRVASLQNGRFDAVVG